MCDVVLRWGAAGGAAVSREITPQRDDVGSCPSVPASICWAEVSLSGTLNLYQLRRLRCVADAALCRPHHGGKTRLENRIHPWRSIKYHISASLWRRVM